MVKSIAILIDIVLFIIRVFLITKVFSFGFVLGGSNENGSTHHISDSDGTFISYRLVIFYIYFLILELECNKQHNLFKVKEQVHIF